MKAKFVFLAMLLLSLISCGEGKSTVAISVSVMPTIESTETALPTPTIAPSLTPTPFPPLSGDRPHLMLLGVHELVVYDHNGRGKKVLPLPSEARVFSSLKNAVSPDGRWLVFFTGSIGNTGLEETLPLILNLLNLTDGTTRIVAEIVQVGYQQKLERVSDNLKKLFPDFYKPIDGEDWVSRRIISEFAWSIKDSIAWSPDSRKLAFAGQIDGLSSDVYLYDVEANSVRRMNDDLESVYDVEWSPDGKYILFENSHPGDTYTGTSLHVLEPNTQVVKDPKYIQYSTWWSKKKWLSPEQLLISEGTDTAGDWDLKILNIKNGQVSHLWKDSFGDAVVDIENRIILLNSSDFSESENTGVYFVGFDGGKEKIIDGLYYFDMVFRGGEKHRFLASGVSVVAENKIDGVLGISLDKKITLLSELPDRKISISPDSMWMLIYNNEEIYLYNASDNLIQSLLVFNLDQIRWRPDSKGLFYSAGKELYYLSFPFDKPTLIDQCFSEYCRFDLDEHYSVWLQ